MKLIAVDENLEVEIAKKDLICCICLVEFFRGSIVRYILSKK
jgi:hypothetical protein